MENPISVGSSYKAPWFLVLAGLTGCLIVGGAICTAFQPDLGIPFLVMGGLMVVAVVVSAAVIAQQRAFAEITPEGFRYQDRHGLREFVDDDVDCVCLFSKSNYVNGELQSVTRTFDVWLQTDAGAQRIRMVNIIKVGENDPLARLINRITNHLLEQARAALEAGQAVEGEGWTLARHELTIRGRKVDDVFRLAELAAVDVFDNRVCIWRQGQDEPAARIPVQSANAHLLCCLLQERLPERDESDASGTTAGLGRILFERKPPTSTKVALWTLFPLAVMAFLTGCIAAVMGARGDLVGIAILVTSLLGLAWLLVLLNCVTFRCHVQGIRKSTFWRDEQLRYEDVGLFSYKAVRQFVNGAYVNTTFTMSFTSLGGEKKRKLVYRGSIRHDDEELDHLRDHISRVIAARMQTELKTGRSVAWTPNLRFLPDGVEYSEAGFLGRKEPRVIPYGSMTTFDCSQGQFQLWVTGQKKAALKESAFQPNFHPGLILLGTLCAAAQDVPLTEPSEKVN